MAEKPRGLDVLIVETGTPYAEVPYTVVTDWIQQGRLLADDKVRVTGTQEWRRIGDVRTLAAFLPRPEPFRAEDRAEALEPVEVGFQWKSGHRGDEDDDVDMIPLIDISLVLLIFFMMTAAVSAGIFSPIDTPPARHQLAVISADMYVVGIDAVRDADGQEKKRADGEPVLVYSLGKGENQLGKYEEGEAEKRQSARSQLTARLAQELAQAKGEVRIRLRANRNLLVDVVRDMTTALQEMEGRLNVQRAAPDRVTLRLFGEVSERQTP